MGGNGSTPPSTTFSAPAGSISPTSFGKIAVDSKQNVWVTTNNGLMEIPAGTTSCPTFSACPLLNLSLSPTGIATDSANNIWVTSSINGKVMEINSSCFSFPSSCPTFTGSPYFSSPTGIAVDSHNNVWVTNDTSSGSVTEITTTAISNATCTSSTCPSFSGLNSFSNPTGIAVDSHNDVWVTNDISSGSVMEILADSTSCSSSSCKTFSGISDPVAVTTTGISPWVANRGTNNNYSPGIIEITSSSCCPEISNFTKPVGLAFDTSGNLWVIDAGNSTTVEITKPAIDSASCTAQTPCYQYSLPAVPVGVVTDSLGNIWISLASAKVIVYKP